MRGTLKLVWSPLTPCPSAALLDLRRLFHAAPVQVVAGEVCEEPAQSHLMDRTPTPTSLEVRGGPLEGLAESSSGCDLH